MRTHPWEASHTNDSQLEVFGQSRVGEMGRVGCVLSTGSLWVWGSKETPFCSHRPHTRCVRAQSLSRVQLFATTWRTAARQAPLSMEVSRQEYQSGSPCPPPGDLSNPGIQPESPILAGRFFTTEPPGKPNPGTRMFSSPLVSDESLEASLNGRQSQPVKSRFWFRDVGWVRDGAGPAGPWHCQACVASLKEQDLWALCLPPSPYQ